MSEPLTNTSNEDVTPKNTGQHINAGNENVIEHKQEDIPKAKTPSSPWEMFVEELNNFGKFRRVIIWGIILIAASWGIFSSIPEEYKKDFWDSIFKKNSWQRMGNAFPNFEIIEQNRLVDLSEWTPANSKADENTGKSIFDDNYIVRKIRPEGEQLCITGGSSGTNPIFSSSTHKYSQKDIKIKWVGWREMKSQVLGVIDVSKEPLDIPFKANFHSVRYGGFTDQKSNWAAIGIWHPTRKLIYTIKFPINKMGRDFRFTTAFFFDKNNFKNITPEFKIDSSKNILEVTVDNPIVGNAYQIEWNW